MAGIPGLAINEFLNGMVPHFVPLSEPQIHECMPFAESGADAVAEIRNRVTELPFL
jgi:hypothetical protein